MKKYGLSIMSKTILEIQNNPNAGLQGGVSDPSNVPYKFITYSSINQIGSQWIRKYTYALKKSYWVLSEVSIVLCRYLMEKLH